jgi:hypothetical protein
MKKWIKEEHKLEILKQEQNTSPLAQRARVAPQTNYPLVRCTSAGENRRGT